MKEFPPYDGNPESWARKVSVTYAQNLREYNKFSSFLAGIRIRTDRSTPTNSANVVGGDRVGDVILAEDGIYYVANNAGTPEWRVVSASSF